MMEMNVDDAVAEINNAGIVENLFGRAAMLRRIFGERPPWWQPFRRAKWDRWVAGVEARLAGGR